MTTYREYNAERDAEERSVLENVRQLVRNQDATPLITARLPFVNKTRSFRGITAFGLDKVTMHTGKSESGTSWIDFYSRGQYGMFHTEELPSEYLTMFYGDLDDIASYRGNVYVVTSYRTVIAWTRSVRNNGVLYVPPVEYSHTTGRHQNITRRAK